MTICPHCSHPINKQVQFCPNCGSGYSNRQRKRKTLILFAAGLLLVIGVFITHEQLKERTGAQATIHIFEKMMAQQDAAAALTLFESQLEDNETTEETMADFLTYVEQDTDWRSLVENWKKEAVSKYKNFETLYSSEGSKLFTIEETGTFLGIYPTYEVIVHPYTLYVKSIVPNTEIMFNEQALTIKKAEEYQEVSDFLPSDTELELSFSAKNEYLDIEDTTSFQSFTDEPNKVSIELPIEAAKITLSSEEPDAIVFINGVSTEKKAKDIGELGPFPLDGTVVIQTQLGNRQSFPEVVDSGGDYDIFLDPRSEDLSLNAGHDYFNPYQMDRDVTLLLDKYLEKSVAAINNRDYSIVEKYHHPGGKSGPESEDYIDYLDSKGITENIIENEVVDYRLADDGLYIDTFETYLIFYEDQSTVEKSFNSTYFLADHEGLWKFYELVETNEI